MNQTRQHGYNAELSKRLCNVIVLGNKYAQLNYERQTDKELISTLQAQLGSLQSERFKLKETMKELEIKLYNALQNIEGKVISFIETSVKPTTDTHEDSSKSELYHVSSEKNVPSETESVHSYQPNQDTHAGVSTHDENTLQHIDNVHTSYSESDSRCTRKTLNDRHLNDHQSTKLLQKNQL